MSTVAHAPVLDAVIALLEAQLGDTLPVGDGEPPANKPMPYAVVLELPGTTSGGLLDQPDADHRVEFQVTSVGQVRAQAAGGADLVRKALCSWTAGSPSHPLVVSGLRCGPVVSLGVGPAMREGSGVGAVWNVPERFSVLVTLA